MNIRYRVELRQSERCELRSLLRSGTHSARKLKRAQVLLAADAGASDAEIAARVVVGGSTVYRIKRRFVEGNLDLALAEAPRAGAARKLTGKEEAVAGGDGLLEAARGSCPLDPGALVGCAGQADRTREPVA